MNWRVRLMGRAGRRIPWKKLENEPGIVGTIRTHYCVYSNQQPYKVAALSGDSPIAASVELIEPQLLAMGDQAFILPGYESVKDEGGTFTVLQEWRREPA